MVRRHPEVGSNAIPEKLQAVAV